MSDQLVPIGMIVVRDRYRQDLGDLSDLMESIREIGLLQPIGITADYRLRFGERRLEACKRLGFDKIAVRILGGRDDAIGLLKAERDENTCRKDMTPSELVALGAVLEEMERPKARERQGGAGRFGSCSGEHEPHVSGRSRGIVANAIGMSGTQYARAKHVVETANDVEAPQAVRAVAKDAQSAMDSGTTTVHGAFQRVREAEAESLSQESHMDRRVIPKVPAAAKVVERVAQQLAGMAVALRNVDFGTTTVTSEQARQIDEGMKALSRMRRSLKEAS